MEGQTKACDRTGDRRLWFVFHVGLTLGDKAAHAGIDSALLWEWTVPCLARPPSLCNETSFDEIQQSSGWNSGCQSAGYGHKMVGMGWEMKSVRATAVVSENIRPKEVIPRLVGGIKSPVC